MLILAGYLERMKRMFDMNPGFKSRIPDSNIYTFDDFSESELIEIADKYLSRNNYKLSPAPCNALGKHLKTDYEHRGKNIGNAQHVINIIQTEILPAMAVRVTTKGLADKMSLIRIHSADIPGAIPQQEMHCRRIGFAAPSLPTAERAFFMKAPLLGLWAILSFAIA